MNKDIVEIFEICLRLTTERKCIAFCELMAHVDGISISLRKIDDYTISHPRWDYHDGHSRSTEEHIDSPNGIRLVLERLRDFEKNCEATDEEIYKEELLRVSG